MAPSTWTRSLGGLRRFVLEGVRTPSFEWTTYVRRGPDPALRNAHDRRARGRRRPRRRRRGRSGSAQAPRQGQGTAHGGARPGASASWCSPCWSDSAWSTPSGTSAATSRWPTHRASWRTGPSKVARRGTQGAAQHPGDGLGHPRGPGQRHRQPDRRWRLGHHDPAPPLGGPEPRLRHQHPARLDGRPARRATTARSPAAGVPAVERPRSRSAGPACTIQQFEQLTGVRVDHYVVVDFNGFQDMVDAIGGVEVCIPETIDDREPRHLPPGRARARSRARRRSTTCGSATPSATAPTSAG